MDAALVETFRGRSALITGGLGFIGSNLARELLEAECRVLLVDSMIPEYGGNFANVDDIHDRVAINVSDIRDPYSMRHLVQGHEFIFNLAGQTSHLDSMDDPFADLDINARSQLFILEACRRHNADARIVFASTRQIYGRPGYLPVDERHPIAPVDVNGVNKTAGEWYHHLYGSVYGLNVTSLRLTNTYGPGMRVKDARQTFLGVWFRRLVDGDELLVFGDGTQRRDFTYVDDAVRAFLLAAADDRAAGEVFNLGAPEVLTLAELAALLVEVNGGGEYRLVPFPADRQAIDIGDYYGDFTKIERTLGWRPEVSLREGVARTLDYYRRNRSRYWDVD